MKHFFLQLFCFLSFIVYLCTNKPKYNDIEFMGRYCVKIVLNLEGVPTFGTPFVLYLYP